jgi:integrase
MTVSTSFLKGAHNKPHPVQRLIPDQHGLSVRISPKGKIAYQLRFTFQKKQSTMTLGHYPAMSLADARQEAIKYQSELKSKGISPSVLKKSLIYQNSDEFSLDAMFDKWHRREIAGQVVRDEDHRRAYNRHIKDEFGSLPINLITRAMWIDLFDRIKIERDAPTVAGFLFLSMRRVLAFSENAGVIEHNPLQSLQKARDLKIKPSMRDRVLTDDEIRLVMHTARDVLSERKYLYFKLTFLTGCRMSETRKLVTENIDFKNGILKTTHKMQKTAGDFLERPITPLVENVLQQAVRIAEPHNDFVFCESDKNEMTRKQASYVATKINKRLKKTHASIPEWSLHDLRRTMRTRMSTVTDFMTAEKMLGHGFQGVHRVYDHHDYMNKMRDAYVVWGEMLTDLSA